MKFVGEKIAIGDVLVSEIAEKYGTPTYVYDEEKIRKTSVKWMPHSKNTILISRCSML